MASNSGSETTPLIGSFARIHDSSNDRSKWNQRRIYASILLTKALERMTYYGLTANLIIYLSLDHTLNVSGYYSIIINNAFIGLSFLMCFLGGWFADAYIGRYKAIIIGLVMYTIGIVLFPIASIPNYFRDFTQSHFPTKPLIIIGLCLVATGCGLVKSNLPPFGAEQVKRRRLGTSNESITQSFFNWFYWSINFGSFFAYLIVAYMQQSEERFFISYLILTGCMLLAIVAFLSSHNIYHIQHHPTNRVGQTLHLITRRLRCCSLGCCHRNTDNDSVTTNSQNSLPDNHLNPPRTPERIISTEYSHSQADSAGSEAEVANITKIAIVFISLLPFWAAYSQVNNCNCSKLIIVVITKKLHTVYCLLAGINFVSLSISVPMTLLAQGIVGVVLSY